MEPIKTRSTHQWTESRESIDAGGFVDSFEMKPRSINNRLNATPFDNGNGEIDRLQPSQQLPPQETSNIPVSLWRNKRDDQWCGCGGSDGGGWSPRWKMKDLLCWRPNLHWRDLEILFYLVQWDRIMSLWDLVRLRSPIVQCVLFL